VNNDLLACKHRLDGHIGTGSGQWAGLQPDLPIKEMTEDTITETAALNARLSETADHQIFGPLKNQAYSLRAAGIYWARHCKPRSVYSAHNSS